MLEVGVQLLEATRCGSEIEPTLARSFGWVTMGAFLFLFWGVGARIFSSGFDVEFCEGFAWSWNFLQNTLRGRKSPVWNWDDPISGAHLRPPSLRA